MAGGPHHLRHHHLRHHHLAVHRHRHDLGCHGRRLRVVRPGLLGLGLGLPVRRLRVRPGLLGHDDGLRLPVRRLRVVRPGLLGLGLGLPVRRLRLHDGGPRDDLRLDDDGLGGRLNDCYGLGGRLHDGSLDDCSLDDMALALSLHQVLERSPAAAGAASCGCCDRANASSLRDLTASRESILQRPKSSLDRGGCEAGVSRTKVPFAAADGEGSENSSSVLRGVAAAASSARPLGEKRAGARHRRRAGFLQTAPAALSSSSSRPCWSSLTTPPSPPSLQPPA